MGFYLEMRRQGPQPIYREWEIPSSFWFLFAVGGFALACMGGAAYAVMWELASEGSLFDRVLLAVIFLFVPFYFAMGIKLAWIRKYVSFEGNKLEVGHRLGERVLYRKQFAKSDIASVELFNERQSPNLAPAQHDDRQYYIRGHWKLAVRLHDGKIIKLDCHTEREALLPLYQDLQKWLEV